jgi:predicted metalloprotease with PDZ domain
VVIATVLADGAAYRAGLNARDEVVAWNGFRVDATTFSERLAQHRPGEEVLLSFFRDEELRSIRVELGARPAGATRLRACKEPSADQKGALAAWLGDE